MRKLLLAFLEEIRIKLAGRKLAYGVHAYTFICMYIYLHMCVCIPLGSVSHTLQRTPWVASNQTCQTGSFLDPQDTGLALKTFGSEMKPSCEL